MVKNQQIDQEWTFRKKILKNYDFIESNRHSLGGLNAIIHAVIPYLDGKSTSVLAFTLLSDMAKYLTEKPEIFHSYMKKKNITDESVIEVLFQSYLGNLLSVDTEIGEFEIRLLSQVLQHPIYVHSYLDPNLDKNDKLITNSKDKPEIHLYYDPLHSRYMLITEKKSLLQNSI